MKKIILLIIFVSSSIFSQWSKVNSFPNSYTYDILINGSTLYVSTGSGIQKSTDGTNSWQLVNNGLNNAQAVQCKQVILFNNILFAATVDGTYRSSDFGANWVKKSEGIVVGNGATYAFAESVYELNGTLFTGTFTGLYRSTNNGENWIASNVSGQHINAKNFTLHNGTIYAARESGNNPNGYTSTDNGVTWQNITFQYPTITFFSEPGKLFTGTIHGAWLSTNNGVNWVNRSTGLSADPYNSSFVRANGVLISSLKFGGSGMYKSNNDGILWEDFSQGLPFLQSIEKLVTFNGKILAATSSGLYQRDISEVTAVTQISNEIPAKFSLEQNYPNPFNPVTKIKFSIPSKNNVKITIFDITGKEISVAADSQMEPGIYEINYDASALTSGIYFYRMESGNFSETKRMILVK